MQNMAPITPTNNCNPFIVFIISPMTDVADCTGTAQLPVRI